VTRLRRSDTLAPGLRRVRRGRGFQYVTAAGGRPEAPDLDRIERLAIPPAWTEVWICPHANGHLQATGVDAAGRRQYLYHPAWRGLRDREKHDHVLSVAARLPAAREIAAGQLGACVLTREVTAKDFRTWHATVLAAVGLAVSSHAAASPSARKRAVGRAVREVAGYLGNTAAVCRRC
jgi:DNA topoisomerase IB